MTHYKDIFKAKARLKELTASDMVTYAICKAMSAKGENKQEILESIISKSFTPGKVCAHRSHPYQAVHQAARDTYRYATSQWSPATVFDKTPIEELYPTEEERTQFTDKAWSLANYNGIK